MNLPTNIVYLPLFSRLALTTNGVAQQKSTLDLDIPQFRTLLAQATAMFLVGVTENVASTDFEWNVAFYSGFDRDHQPATPTNIAAANFNATSPQGQRSADYTNTATFLPYSRLQVWWQNPGVISGVKVAVVSAVLGLRLST